jgi:replicative DNA helicase
MLPENREMLVLCLLLKAAGINNDSPAYTTRAKDTIKRIDSDYFEDPEYRKIYRECADAISSEQELNLISLDDRYPNSRIYTDILPIESLLDYGSVIHLSDYTDDLIEEHNQRLIKKIAKVSTSTASSQDKLAEVQYYTEQIKLTTGGLQPKLIKDLYAMCKDRAEKIPCGYTNIDDAIGGGFERKRLYTIAARPNCGKSTMLVNLATKFASSELKTAFLTLEEPTEHSVQKFANLLTADKDIRDADEACDVALSDPNNEKVNNHLVVTEYGNKVNLMASLCGDYDVILVDQLSFMKTDKPTESKALEVSTVVHDLKEYAVKHNKVLIMACQINREGNNHKGEVPQLHHLKDSGGIEEASDVCILMHTENEDKIIHANIAKNRCGSKQVVYMNAVFDKCKISPLLNYDPNANQPKHAVYNFHNDKDLI